MTGNTPAFPVSELPSRLNSERDAMRAFIALLEKEQQCLLHQDAEQLLPIAEAKTAAANKLTELANARRQFMNNADTVAWLAQHAPACSALWSEIRKLGAHAHQLNQTNGEVIQLKLRSNQQALTALLGAAKSAAGLYGRDGQPSIAVSGRTLGNV